MAATLVCPSCRVELSLPRARGQRVRCGACGHVFFLLRGQRAVQSALVTQKIPVQHYVARAVNAGLTPSSIDRIGLTLQGLGRAGLPPEPEPPVVRISIPPPAPAGEPAIPSSPDLVIEEERVVPGGWELLAAGTEVAGYVVERPIARGGSAIVYAARHRATGVPFALKVLRESLMQHRVALARFRQELRLLEALEHPGVVRVHDVGALVDGRPYLVLDWLEGDCLRDRLAGGQPLTADDAFALYEQLCDALGAVHETGIVHRDLKPENVFVAYPGGRLQAKLLDFGAAKLLAIGSQPGAILTRPGLLIGSPEYMSPEQMLGKRVDARSDLFALGIMLYETFGGGWPWPTSSLWGTLDMRTQAPARASERLARRSPMLDGLVMRCLRMSPAERPDSARAVQRELARARAEWPARVRHVGHVGPISVLGRRAPG